LFGRSFELLTRRKAWGEDRVFFYEGEHLRGVPASWTDAVPAAVFVTLAAGRAHFRPEDLWRLVGVVDELMGSRGTSPAPGRQLLRPAEKVSRKLRRSCKDKDALMARRPEGKKKRKAKG
jgi:uncharacterized protein DUF5372